MWWSRREGNENVLRQEPTFQEHSHWAYLLINGNYGNTLGAVSLLSPTPAPCRLVTLQRQGLFQASRAPHFNISTPLILSLGSSFPPCPIPETKTQLSTCQIAFFVWCSSEEKGTSLCHRRRSLHCLLWWMVEANTFWTPHFTFESLLRHQLKKIKSSHGLYLNSRFI